MSGSLYLSSEWISSDRDPTLHSVDYLVIVVNIGEGILTGLQVLFSKLAFVTGGSDIQVI